MSATPHSPSFSSPVSIKTREWRDLRKRWQARLPAQCSRCPELVQPWDEWDLDHADIPRALGGDNSGARPAHRSCNRKAGLELGQAISAAGKQALLNEAGRQFDNELGNENEKTPPGFFWGGINGPG